MQLVFFYYNFITICRISKYSQYCQNSAKPNSQSSQKEQLCPNNRTPKMYIFIIIHVFCFFNCILVVSNFNHLKALSCDNDIFCEKNEPITLYLPAHLRMVYKTYNWSLNCVNQLVIWKMIVTCHLVGLYDKTSTWACFCLCLQLSNVRKCNIYVKVTGNTNNSLLKTIFE